MKEAGDGLQDQMNSMMGALQELKLLQVQTALEQLEISGLHNQPPHLIHHQPRLKTGKEESKVRQRWLGSRLEGKSSHPGISGAIPSPSVASPGLVVDMPASSWSEGYPKEVPHQEVQRPATSSMASDCLKDGADTTRVDLGPGRDLAATATEVHRPPAASKILGGGPTQASDGSNDWTSSLLSQSRNRQPLILGDNVFADLVGNWLDLPELEKMSQAAPARRDHLPLLTKSQEFQKKLTLTANIFKKLLRSVRPDKVKRAQAPPPANPSEAISKRSSKTTKQKVTFYFALRGNGTQTSRPVDSPGIGTPLPEEHSHRASTCTRKPTAGTHSQFDYNTVVWV
ncbi:PAK4-inhibitor INKA2 isoform X2 [Amblyraja radiata]|nr:PAK4-inhibitor INKA2 isoform X2 [Amblyraja radiata]XP_032898691.1 PAK4-inhibitor INKA2 isoform X2 [Amblyraja radiata]XP_032898693.1 PAK4-inhibitor INKA2 isoform X2 [Amblyraja radiata]